MIDCVYIAANARDIRFTRICIASVRAFYPDVEIRILRGGVIKASVLRELERYWGARPADFEVGDYGWGFVKLEPLFGRPGERFLVLDSDTVITGPVLEIWGEGEGPFLVDDEQQSEADTKRLYYDWRQVLNVASQTQKPQFVFNSGQWFGTAGVVSREDFSPWVVWDMPRALRHPELFMPGDQGVLNYVLNQGSVSRRFNVSRRKLMRWPGHGMEGFSARAVSDCKCPARIVHWAGMKAFPQSRMVGSDLLDYYENLYYHRLPYGVWRKWAAQSSDVISHLIRSLRTRAEFALSRRFFC